MCVYVRARVCVCVFVSARLRARSLPGRPAEHVTDLPFLMTEWSRMPRADASSIPCNRQTGRRSDRQTDRHRRRQTERQTEGQTDRRTEEQTYRQRDRQTEAKTDRQTDRQTGRQTDRQADRQTGRQTHSGQPHIQPALTVKAHIVHSGIGCGGFI